MVFSCSWKASFTSTDTLAKKFIHNYVWYFFVKATLKKECDMLHFQTALNLATQLIAFLKVKSLLQINLYGWERCILVFAKANLNGMKLTRYFYTVANTLIDNVYVIYRGYDIIM